MIGKYGFARRLEMRTKRVGSNLIKGVLEDMRVTLEEVDRIASLSMLKLDDEKRKMLQQNLSEILEHAERLNELDTDGVEPTTYILQQQNIFREDAVTQQWERKSMLQNAPEQEDGCFVVPKVVE